MSISITDGKAELDKMKEELSQSQADLVTYQATINLDELQPLQARMINALSTNISSALIAITSKEAEIENFENTLRIIEQDINQILNPLEDVTFINDNIDVCDDCHLLLEDCECRCGNDDGENDSDQSGYN